MESSSPKGVSLVYRDNDLFQALVPTVVDEMQALGLEVDSKVFPKGEDPAKIAEWVEANRARLKEMSLVVDGTVGAQNRAAFCSTPSLDGIMHAATLATILPDFVWDIRDDGMDEYGSANYDLLEKPGAHRAVFLEIMRRIAENDKLPKRVFICLDKLAEHEPFRDEAKERELSSGGNWYGSTRKTQYDGGKNQEAFETLTAWLTEAGVEEVEAYDGQDLNGSSDWVLVDRHALPSNNQKFLPNNPETPVMVLPAENFVASALKNGLLDGFNPEAVQLNIRGTVRKLFAKVSE